MLDLSIVIINYNTRFLLSQCLESLRDSGLEISGFGKSLSSDGKYRAEVIVVDNASTDGSCQMLRTDFKWVRLIASDQNLGFARGNNLALPLISGRYVLFLNSDTEVKSGCLKTMIAYMDSYAKVGVATCKLVLRDGSLDPDCHRGFPTPWASFCYFSGLEKFLGKLKLFGQYHQKYKDFDKIHEIDACCGAFLLIRTEILKELRGWSEDYFFYGEDLDLCYRVKRKGFKIVYNPQAQTVHYKGASSGLRKETKDVVTTDRETQLKVARESARAMEIFYNKFYKDKYCKLMTFLVLTAVRLKGFFRVCKVKRRLNGV